VCDFCCKKLPFPANFVVCISASKLFFSFNLLGSEFFVSWVEFDFIEAYKSDAVAEAKSSEKVLAPEIQQVLHFLE